MENKDAVYPAKPGATRAERIRKEHNLIPDEQLQVGREYRAMLQMRWYRVVYLGRTGIAGGKLMHRFQWITGPRHGQSQTGWAAFKHLRPIPGVIEAEAAGRKAYEEATRG
jgi:hypothetical protein